MNTSQLEQLLVSQNPHWSSPSIYEDTLRLKRTVFPLFWEQLTNNRLIMAINGPRRIGKSYLMKQLIANLIKTETVNPKNILYFSFNTGLNEKDIISQVLNFYLKNFSISSHEQKYIFFDELQFISLWPDQIKAIYDLETPLKFVVTGSTSIFYGQKSKESLLGRLSKFPLGVLSFEEYLQFKNLKKPVSRINFVENLPLIRQEFREYLVSGQLPEVLTHSNIDSKKYYLDIAEELINFDIPYFYTKLDRVLFSNLVKTLSIELANEVSLNKLALNFEVSRGTIGSYIHILEETGYFSLCYNSFFKKMRAKVSGIKKIYSLNTNLSLAINGLDKNYFNDSRVLGHYAENYAFMRLKEKYGQNLEYYSDRKYEVDFVTNDTVFEVKFGRIDNTDKYVEVAKKLGKKLIFITENEMEENKDFVKIPLYLL